MIGTAHPKPSSCCTTRIWCLVHRAHFQDLAHAVAEEVDNGLQYTVGIEVRDKDRRSPLGTKGWWADPRGRGQPQHLA